MNPDIYLLCLRWIETRDDLQSSSLRPVQAAEIMALEEELGLSLPCHYENHLLRVGSGSEHGGLAVWFHLDRTMRGNIFQANEILRRSNGKSGAPENFLAVYDCLDGEVFGFCHDNKEFSPEIYCFDSDEGELSLFADSLEELYLECLDCSEAEIEAIELGEVEILQ